MVMFMQRILKMKYTIIRTLTEIKYFLKTHDDIEMFVIASLLGTIAAFYIYCVWSLVT